MNMIHTIIGLLGIATLLFTCFMLSMGIYIFIDHICDRRENHKYYMDRDKCRERLSDLYNWFLCEDEKVAYILAELQRKIPEVCSSDLRDKFRKKFNSEGEK